MFRIGIIVVALLGAIALAVSGHAQSAQRNRLNLDGAKKTIAAAVTEAKRLKAPGAAIAGAAALE